MQIRCIFLLQVSDPSPDVSQAIAAVENDIRFYRFIVDWNRRALVAREEALDVAGGIDKLVEHVQEDVPAKPAAAQDLIESFTSLATKAGEVIEELNALAEQYRAYRDVPSTVSESGGAPPTKPDAPVPGFLGAEYPATGLYAKCRKLAKDILPEKKRTAEEIARFIEVASNVQRIVHEQRKSVDTETPSPESLEGI